MSVIMNLDALIANAALIEANASAIAAHPSIVSELMERKVADTTILPTLTMNESRVADTDPVALLGAVPIHAGGENLEMIVIVATDEAEAALDSISDNLTDDTLETFLA